MKAEITKDTRKLIDAALEVRRFASASYSHFPVGAALENKDGRIWSGCNVESSSYGLSVCAERAALFKVISEGGKDFIRLAVTASGKGVIYPCGACRQLLYNYAPELLIYLFNPDNSSFIVKSLKELYPYPFGDYNL